MNNEIKEIKKYLYRGVEFDTYEEAALTKEIDEDNELKEAVELLGGEVEGMFDCGEGVILLSEKRVNKAKEIFIKLANKKYKDCNSYESCVRNLLGDKKSSKGLYRLYFMLESITNIDNYGWVRVGQPYYTSHFLEVRKNIIADLRDQ